MELKEDFVAGTRRKSLSVFALLGVAGVILTGCTPSDDATTTSSGASSSPSAESTPSETPVAEQSVGEACNVLIEGVTEMQSTLTDNAAQLQTDPAAAAAAYKDVVALFQENAAKVTNEEVKPAADKIGAVFVTFGETMDAAAVDPNSVDPQAVTNYATDLQTTTQEMGVICGTP